MNLKHLGESIGLEEIEYRELLLLFLDSGAAVIARIKEGLRTNRCVQVAKSAHTLNGAAGNLGLRSIHEAAARIENAANRDRLHTVTEDLVYLEKHFHQLSCQFAQDNDRFT
jgi:HPt (histidine-containing phosphotransfer) domain-containing protein